MLWTCTRAWLSIQCLARVFSQYLQCLQACCTVYCTRDFLSEFSETSSVAPVPRKVYDSASRIPVSVTGYTSTAMPLQRHSTRGCFLYSWLKLAIFSTLLKVLHFLHDTGTGSAVCVYYSKGTVLMVPVDALQCTWPKKVSVYCTRCCIHCTVTRVLLDSRTVHECTVYCVVFFLAGVYAHYLYVLYGTQRYTPK